MIVWAVLAVGEARSELTSDELLLIYNANSTDSKELAEYYAERRAVPRQNLIGLDLPLTEDISRVDYDEKIVWPLRRYLWDKDLAAKVRCLVTFYDVPLRVGPRVLTEAEQARVSWMKVKHRRYLAELHGAINGLHALVEGIDPEQKAHVEREQDAEDELRMAFYYYRKHLATRVAYMKDEKEADAIRVKFMPLAVVMDGLDGAEGHLNVTPELLSKAATDRLAELREAASGSGERAPIPPAENCMSDDYPEAIRELAKWKGLAAAYGRLDRDLKTMDFRRSDAAVDSELALLWWRPYKLIYQIANWLSCRANLNATDQNEMVRKVLGEVTLMHCRLDGPSPQVVRRMIDDAIEVEQRGLSGTVYVDLDPTRNTRELTWQVRALQWFIELVGTKTAFQVVVDDTPELFRPGGCPNTAMYCGWYSLMEYVNAFEFVPGAVAYHIASGEAISLRDPTATYWCKEILNDGAAATLGAVMEPFLRGIPRPDEFFGLLMTGEFTLAETFALANPWVSWRVIVLGDPLYNPFKTCPQVVVEDVLTPSMLPLDYSAERFRALPKGPEDLVPRGTRPVPQ
ncbi:MAG: TIGR03790 family protein [Phycisphaerales bacterium]|nr:MAG: TIGR03790 family protein [Phycisphaerales bacterium]